MLAWRYNHRGHFTLVTNTVTVGYVFQLNFSFKLIFQILSLLQFAQLLEIKEEGFLGFIIMQSFFDHSSLQYAMD